MTDKSLFGPYTLFRTLASWLTEKSRTFLDLLSTLDDPYGDYRFALGAHVDHLEAELRALRSQLGKSRGETLGKGNHTGG
ncbi:hypothetical protein [Bradyrhizobium sp. 30]|uniref:hypothetical protein n=1 Tax=Bradyrhizobium sp. 30 TaxID=2782669 RepID=UPI001FFAA851|nr:hypothetical protein [Bradyrhizobium sp. 30]MCK1290907.1 hypothetical protein [Bradyrhizobium sp. 30]